MSKLPDYNCFAISLFYLICMYSAATAQQCPGNRQKTLVKVQQLFRYNYSNPCIEITDFTTYVASFLDVCSFTPVANVISFMACQSACANNVTCVAMTLSVESGCEHCLQTNTNGNGNSYPQQKVMIAVEALWNFIDGN